MIALSPASAAVTASVPAPPQAPISSPPMAGPSVEAVRSTVPIRPVVRSSGTPARLVTSGTNTLLAAFAGPSAAPDIASSSISRGRLRMSSAWRTGIAPSVAATIESPRTLIRFGPTRSIRGPDRAWAITYGAICAKTTRPVCSALPVVVRTNQGTASEASRVPVHARAFAPSRAVSPRQRPESVSVGIAWVRVQLVHEIGRFLNGQPEDEVAEGGHRAPVVLQDD